MFQPILRIVSRVTLGIRPQTARLYIRNFQNLTSVVEIHLTGKIVRIDPDSKEKLLRQKDPSIIIIEVPNAHNSQPSNFFEIELHTPVFNNVFGKKWIQAVGVDNGQGLVKERWIFKHEGKPIREAYNVETEQWCETNFYIANDSGQEFSFKSHNNFHLLNFFRRLKVFRFTNKRRRSAILILILMILTYLILKF